VSDQASEIAQNLRFYSDARFKQLTLLLAAMAAAAAGAVKDSPAQLTPTVTVRQLVAVAAMLVVSVLWVMEVRAAAYWAAHREKGTEVWPSPPTNVFWWLNATDMLLALHVGLFVGWWWFGMKWRLAAPWLALAAALFVLMAIFSVVTYRPLWKHGLKRYRSKKAAG
jgi:membrane protein YdbS with pleckstrin-like domain